MRNLYRDLCCCYGPLIALVIFPIALVVCAWEWAFGPIA